MEIVKTETFIENEIFIDGVKIGEVELCPERKEIVSLVIYEPYRNKGYGTEVVQTLIKDGYDNLQVRSHNYPAEHVYKKCGFVRSKETMYEMRLNKAESEGKK